MTYKWAVIASFLALAGCAHATGSALPPLVEYSPEFQKQLKTELQAARPTSPALNEFVKDSIKLRDKVRAGHKITKTKPFKLFKR